MAVDYPGHGDYPAHLGWPGQVDYRSEPSAGGVDLSGQKVGSYDSPVDVGSDVTQPYPDQTFKSYDVAGDALSYGSLRPPFADTVLKGTPASDSAGWSPDGPRQLAWERAGGDGSPPAGGMTGC